METNYPWDGAVKLTVGSNVKKDIRLRIPAWCKNYTVSVNGAPVEPAVEIGYAVLPGTFAKGDVIELVMDMPVEVVAADPRVKEDEGMRAIQRGPLVYCIEEVDNPENFDALTIAENAEFTTAFEPELLKGVMTVTAKVGENTLKYIPYYSWDNREAGKMKVWVPLVQ